MTSLSVSVFPKIVAFIFLISLTRAAAGSCLSYGHSCWGGHGKRSTSLRHILNPPSAERRGNEWYFSKMMKILKERPIESPAEHKVLPQDYRNFDGIIRKEHQKYPYVESMNDVVTRNPDALVLDNDSGEREAPELNEVDVQSLFVPDDDYIIWNSKMDVYQKMVENDRRERSG